MIQLADDGPDGRRSKLLYRTVILTVAIEVFTLALRYVFAMQSTRDTASTIGAMTFGLRIHHGYVGLLLLLGAWFAVGRGARLRPHLIVWGAALVASDVIHHFLILWPIEGSPEFDIWYGAAAHR